MDPFFWNTEGVSSLRWPSGSHPHRGSSRTDFGGGPVRHGGSKRVAEPARLESHTIDGVDTYRTHLTSLSIEKRPSFEWFVVQE